MEIRVRNDALKTSLKVIIIMRLVNFSSDTSSYPLTIAYNRRRPALALIAYPVHVLTA